LPDSSLAGQEHGRTIPLGDIDAALRSSRKCAAPLLIGLPFNSEGRVGAREINRINGSKDFVNLPTA